MTGNGASYERVDYTAAPRVFDRHRKFGTEVRSFLKACGFKAVRTNVRSPRYNGVAEIRVGSIRREVVDHSDPAGRATSDAAQPRICSLL